MAGLPIQLVCFDLGGVLVKICGDWAEACRLAGVSKPTTMSDAQTVQHVDAINTRYETGQIDDASFERQVAEATGLTPQVVATLCGVWLKGPYPGAEALLDRLESTGVRTACLSNTNARHWRIMNGETSPALPLERLHYRFASHRIGVMKPQPQAYEHVERTSGTDPESILFFDDSTENCHAARQCGWQAEQIDPQGDTVGQMQTHLQRYGML